MNIILHVNINLTQILYVKLESSVKVICMCSRKKTYHMYKPTIWNYHFKWLKINKKNLIGLNIYQKTCYLCIMCIRTYFFPGQIIFFYHLLQNIYWGKYCVHCSISLVLLLYKYCITLFPISSAVCEFITAHSTWYYLVTNPEILIDDMIKHIHSHYFLSKSKMYTFCDYK